MPGANVTKSYVRPDKTAVITCPYCHRQKEVNVTSFKEHKNRFKIKCACKEIFLAEIEFRQRIRKKTYLKGTYTNQSRNNVSGNITITNLSVSGLEFTSYETLDLDVGDVLMVEFNLDDDHHTEITREAVVRSVRKSSVGCEFTESGNIALDGPLGNYLAKI